MHPFFNSTLPSYNLILTARSKYTCLVWICLVLIGVASPSAAISISKNNGSINSANNNLSKQCFDWASTHSIARQQMFYPDASTGRKKDVNYGELCTMKCDSIVCPNPPVRNCYMKETICNDNEWCQLEDESRFGPWATSNDGETPNFGPYSCDYLKENGYRELFQKVCDGRGHWGPWPTVRGRCIKYRTEQQSCRPLWGSSKPGFSLNALLSPHYASDPETGHPPVRPLLCAPGLVCTGETEPIPFTCVKERPKDICYIGSWWDSAEWCRSQLEDKDRRGGLSREQLENAVRSLLIQLPVEAYPGGPSNVQFWESYEANRARDGISAIVETLWPDEYRQETEFPILLPDPRESGPVGSSGWNSTAQIAQKYYRQPNKLWSAVHVLIHNAREPMSADQVEASRSLAVWLRQHYMCVNCRGFWGRDILNVVGLPPRTMEREEHKKWWWRAHNMVSEHSAATRGGHPWVWPAMTDEEFQAEYGKISDRLRCQNPWFMPYETANEQWTF